MVGVASSRPHHPTQPPWTFCNVRCCLVDHGHDHDHHRYHHHDAVDHITQLFFFSSCIAFRRKMSWCSDQLVMTQQFVVVVATANRHLLIMSLNHPRFSKYSITLGAAVAHVVFASRLWSVREDNFCNLSIVYIIEKEKQKSFKFWRECSISIMMHTLRATTIKMKNLEHVMIIYKYYSWTAHPIHTLAQWLFDWAICLSVSDDDEIVRGWVEPES